MAEPEYAHLAAVLAGALRDGLDPVELFDTVIARILEEYGFVARTRLGLLEMLDEVESVASPAVCAVVQRWREQLVLFLGAVGRES